MNKVERYMRLRRPCVDCPFVVKNEFPLTKERRKQIADSLRRSETFHCHKTIEYLDDDEGGYNTENSSRCFGAASVLHNEGRAPMLGEQIAVRLDMADAPVYPEPEDSGVYMSLQDFQNEGWD